MWTCRPSQAALQAKQQAQMGMAAPVQPAAWSVDGGLVLHEAAGTAVEDHVRDLIQEKIKRELTRTYVSVLGAWLALSGDLSKAFINYQGD